MQGRGAWELLYRFVAVANTWFDPICSTLSIISFKSSISKTNFQNQFSNLKFQIRLVSFVASTAASLCLANQLLHLKSVFQDCRATTFVPSTHLNCLQSTLTSFLHSNFLHPNHDLVSSREIVSLRLIGPAATYKTRWPQRLPISAVASKNCISSHLQWLSQNTNGRWQ